MTRAKISRIVLTACALAALAPAHAARAIVIDSFSVNQAQLSVVGFTNDTSQVINGTLLGGDRDLGIAGGAASVGTSMTDVSGGTWNYDGTAQTGATAIQPGFAVVDYDGPGNSNAFIGGSGLGGIDLTSGGTDNAFLVRINSYSADFGAGVARLFIAALDTVGTPVVSSIDLSADIAAPTDIVIPFSSFGGLVDFTSIGEVRLNIQGHEMSFAVDSFETTHVVAEPASLAALGLGLVTFAAAGFRASRGARASFARIGRPDPRR